MLNALTLAVFFTGTVTWDIWFQGTSLFSLNDNLSSPVKGLAIYVIYHFFFYWWHRARHHYAILWKTFHQIHHSIRRIEVLSSNYLHPLDALSGLILGAAVAYLLLGVDAQATAWAISCTRTLALRAG